MNEVFDQATDFLNAVFKAAGFDLRTKALEVEGGAVLDIDGEDVPFLRGEGGELLDALEVLVNQAFTRSLPHPEHITCDAGGYRATRELELRAMARHAAERVRATGVPFSFGPMSPNERRVIHLALANDEVVRTESVGEGNLRRLRVSLKPSN